MAVIKLDILARLQKTSIERAEKETVERFTKMGQDAGDALTQGIEKKSPRIRRALLSAADAAVDYARKIKTVNKTLDEHNKLLDDTTALEHAATAEMARGADVADKRTQAEKDLAQAEKSRGAQARGIATREKNLRDLKEAHAKTAAKLRVENLKLSKISDDEGRAAAKKFRQRPDYRALKSQNASELSSIAQKTTALAQARAELETRTTAANAVDERRKELLKEEAESVKSLNGYETELQKTRERSSKVHEDLLRQNEEITRSNNKREESLRNVARAEAEDDKRKRGGGAGGKKSRFTGTVGNILTSIPGVPSGPAGALIGGPIVVALADVAQAAVTASQSVALLPAVVTMAAAGMGTLALATHGFGDALKNMGDPEKWAEGLQSLSPAAQQAALEIKFLVDGPLGDLQNATQETLFDGVAEQLHGLTDQFLPTIQNLTVGIAGAFNTMWDNLVGQLMTPETQTSIGNIVNNLVTAFQNLAPAVGPVVDAFLRLTEVGSSFLPGLATSLANAATTFANWITKLQDDGSLQAFIQKGIDAAGALIHTIGELGTKIFEVFGNKSPAEFQTSLDAIVNSVMTVLDLLVQLAHIADDALKFLNPIADAIGGWPVLIVGAIGAFELLKVGGMASMMSLAGAGGIGAVVTGLGAILPAAALAAAAIAAIKFNDQGLPTPDDHDPRGQSVSQQLIGNTPGKWFDSKLQDLGFNVGANKYRPEDHATPTAPTGSPFGPAASGSAPPTAFGPGAAGGPFAPSSGPLFGSQVNDAAPPGAPPKLLPTAGLGPAGIHPVPVPTPKDADGSKITDTEKVDRAYAALNPSQFAVDPHGGMGPFPKAQGAVDQQKVLEKDHQLQSDAWDIQEAAMKLESLKQSGVASQKEIIAADRKLTELKWKLQGDQADLVKLQLGDVEKKKKDDLSAGLDPDLGLSNGLAGFADNMVRFAGHMLMAPVEAALQNVIDSDPIKGGSGLFGIMGAQNMAAGLSPLLGKPLSDGTTQGSFAQSLLGTPGTTASSSATLGGTGAAGAAMPGESDKDFAHRVMVPYWASQGIQAGDHAADSHGEHQNGALDLPVSSIAQGQQVLAQVLSDPNTYGAIFNNQTFGYGHGTTPQDYSAGHTGDPSQDHTNHVHAFYKPGGAGNITPVPGGGAMPGSFGGPGGGVIPVFVTNMGGGGGGLLGGPGTIGASGGAYGGPNRESGGGPAGPGAEGWRNTVAQTVAQYAPKAGIPQGMQQKWVDAIVKQIDIESKGDAGVTNDHDSDGKGGTQSVSGLLQYLPSSYAGSGGKLTGLPMMDPVGQIAGALMAPRNPDGSPAGLGSGGGWGPDLNTPIGGGTRPGPGEGGPMPMTPFNPFGTPPGPGGAPAYPGTTPGAAPYPGMPWPGTQFPTGGSPFGAPDMSGVGTPMPAGGGPLGGPPGVGPFGVPQGVANTQGVPGASAQTPLTPGSGAPGQSGWAPQQAGPTAPVGGAPKDGGWQPSGGGGLGFGGGAMGAALGAAAGMVPGVGQLAQTAMQGIDRTIQYGGQLASIGVQGLMETFGLSDESGLGNLQSGWAGRLAAGFAGARPATPTSAGQSQTPVAPQVDPNTTDHGQGQGAPPGPGGHMVNIESFVQAPNRNSQQTIDDLAFKTNAQGNRQ